MERKIYFIKDVEKMLGCKRHTLRYWWEAEKFPKPGMVGNRLAWRVEVIDEWFKDLKLPE